jgi:hypothetical protein
MKNLQLFQDSLRLLRDTKSPWSLALIYLLGHLAVSLSLFAINDRSLLCALIPVYITGSIFAILAHGALIYTTIKHHETPACLSQPLGSEAGQSSLE